MTQTSRRQFIMTSTLAAASIGIPVIANAADRHAAAPKKQLLTGPMQYPHPRYPDYVRRPLSTADLLKAARETLSIPGRPLGNVRSDAHVLIVTTADQDAAVQEAILEAFRERGIRVTAKPDHELGILPRPEQLDRLSIADGWKEIVNEYVAKLLPPEIAAQIPKAGNYEPLRTYLANHPQYTTVFVGDVPPLVQQALKDQGHKVADKWDLHRREDLVARVFPDDLWKLIEAKTLRYIPQIAEVHITDPEGTNLQFTVTKDEAALWNVGATGHGDVRFGQLYMSPVSATRAIVQFGIAKPEDEQRVFPKANGIIGVTVNHCGYYPHMICHVEDGVVVRFEGGGKYGELLSEVLNKTKNVQYPRFPRPGYFYVDEISMGSNPRVFRRREGAFDHTYRLFNENQCWRSGHIKWGFGAQSQHPEVKAFGKEHGLPTMHFPHAYSQFATYKVRLRSGEWITLIDKGHLTALDDPEVRKMAARYGDPDEVLTEDWFPAVPGINYPGDYKRDYGANPVAWVRRENEDRLPPATEVPSKSR